MPLHDVLGQYNSKDLMSPYDVANALNEISRGMKTGLFSGVTAAQVATTSFGTPPNAIRTIGFNTPGIGGGLYVKVDVQPAYPGWIRSADGFYYVYVPENGVWVTAFGAVPLVDGNDTSPDSWQAFEDAKYFILNQPDPSSHTMRVPSGFFYLSKAHSIEGAAYDIQGEGRTATVLRFPTKCDGIQIQYNGFRTFGHEGAPYNSGFDQIKGLEVSGWLFGPDWHRVYVCTQGGAGTTEGPGGTGTGIVVGSARFDYVRELTASEIKNWSVGGGTSKISRMLIWSHWDSSNLAENDDDVTVPGGGFHSGIVMRTRAVVEDVQVIAFPGHGIAVVADGDPEVRGGGNVNAWHLNRVAVFYNGYDGVHVGYSDANAGEGIAIDSGFNGRWGVADWAFLTNTWINIQSLIDGAHISNPNIAKYQTYCTHNGYIWIARQQIKGLDPDGFPNYHNEPGTDPRSWILGGGDGTLQPTDNMPAWNNTARWQPSGAFSTNNTNNRATFFGLYTESGTPAGQIAGPSAIYGGIGGIETTRNAKGYLQDGWIAPIFMETSYSNATGNNDFSIQLGTASVDGLSNGVPAERNILIWGDSNAEYRFMGLPVSGGTITGSIAPEVYTDAVFDGFFSAGNLLNVTNVTSGTINVNAAVVGTGVPAGVSIAGGGTGTGGVGTYFCFRPYPAPDLSGISGTGWSAQRNATVLTVTADPNNSITLGAFISGSGISSGTAIAKQIDISGHPISFTGGTGRYTVSITQTAASTTITVTPDGTKHLDYGIRHISSNHTFFGHILFDTKRTFGRNAPVTGTYVSRLLLGVGNEDAVQGRSVTYDDLSGGLPAPGDFADGEVKFTTRCVSGKPAMVMYNKTAGTWFSLKDVP